MCDRKDIRMIEIDLNAPQVSTAENSNASANSYLSNLRLFRFKERSEFPYMQHNGDAAPIAQSSCKDTQYVGVSQAASPAKISCLRQMYCPDCEQRLHADDINYDRILYCCLPLFPLSCLYWRTLSRPNMRGHRVKCKKCGGNLGYWKQI